MNPDPTLHLTLTHTLARLVLEPADEKIFRSWARKTFSNVPQPLYPNANPNLNSNPTPTPAPTPTPDPDPDATIPTRTQARNKFSRAQCLLIVSWAVRQHGRSAALRVRVRVRARLGLGLGLG